MIYHGLPRPLGGLLAPFWPDARLALAGAILAVAGIGIALAWRAGEHAILDRIRTGHGLADLSLWIDAAGDSVWQAECECGDAFHAPRKHMARRAWRDHSRTELEAEQWVNA